MAKFRIDGMDALIKDIEKAGRMDEIAPKAINEALPILEAATRNAVAGAASKGYSKGELAKSIKGTRAKKNQYGYFSVVKPNGKDKKGVSNEEKLIRLQYGRSGQLPHPCLEKAVNSAEGECQKVMETIIMKEVGAE